MEEVHRAEKAISALKKIDALIPRNTEKLSLSIIRGIIKKALADEV